MAGKSKVIGIRFLNDDYEAIKAQADLHKIDISTYIRKAVLSKIEELQRISNTVTPCEMLYEVKESLYALILDLKLNSKCKQKGGDNHVGS